MAECEIVCRDCGRRGRVFIDERRTKLVVGNGLAHAPFGFGESTLVGVCVYCRSGVKE